MHRDLDLSVATCDFKPDKPVREWYTPLKLHGMGSLYVELPNGDVLQVECFRRDGNEGIMLRAQTGTLKLRPDAANTVEVMTDWKGKPVVPWKEKE